MNSKILSLLAIAVFSINFTFAQKGNKDDTPPTYELTYEGTKYTLKEGDTVHLGYGSNPYGSFMYLRRTEDNLPKELAGKDAIISKIKHINLGNIDRIMMKIKPAWVFWTDGIEQAIDKREIIGINDVNFHEETLPR